MDVFPAKWIPIRNNLRRANQSWNIGNGLIDHNSLQQILDLAVYYKIVFWFNFLN